MTLAQKTLQIALGQVGVEEVPRGSNRGPVVEQYLSSVHLPPGNPWCASFVSWCVIEATKIVGGPPFFKPSGSVMTLLHLNDLLVVSEPGDDACYVFVKEHADHVHGHTGLWVSNGLTCEGNSNDEGSREGYEVCRLSRPRSSIKAFIRIG